MTQRSAVIDGPVGVPAWVPKPAWHYLAHTETGAPIRALARDAGCHASTILRQIRRFEARRDDYLVDEALRRLGRQVLGRKPAGSHEAETVMMPSETPTSETATLTEEKLKAEALRILKHLCDPGAVLAVAADMDKAAVIKETAGRTQARSSVVEREVAEAMALKNWIACDGEGRVVRYRITTGGRNALNRLMAEAENHAFGFAEAPTPFAPAGDDAARPSGRARRTCIPESPLTALARRRDRDGAPFLTPELVRAGERLREDFELAQMPPRMTSNWERLLTGPDRMDGPGGDLPGGSAGLARTRVMGALQDLGPGLGDVALRCCCHLQGLEQAERKMGWSARSGKIVLRIALQRLKAYYDGLGESGGLIG
ncbi:DUF6456 domain-containing protein [Roseovarius sp. SYSU LYC5161]|uniref:DUF6456 domain-containing protein n=1 Tax=Roseovarius halophilus (ex Wu et al. 2025) TaxID=3376060 RepID=UPI00399BA455